MARRGWGILGSIILAVTPIGAAAQSAPACAGKRVCGDMTTCAEAVHYLRNCGVSSLDRDGDGVPCETMCGKSLDVMAARLSAQPLAHPDQPATARASLLGADGTGASPDASGFACGAKRTCKQMTSCAEATFHLTKCGVTSLDGNSDGIPCNGLCR